MNELKGKNVLKFGYIIFCSCTRCLMAYTNKQLRTLEIELNFMNVLSHVEQLFQYW